MELNSIMYCLPIIFLLVSQIFTLFFVILFVYFKYHRAIAIECTKIRNLSITQYQLLSINLPQYLVFTFLPAIRDFFRTSILHESNIRLLSQPDSHADSGIQKLYLSKYVLSICNSQEEIAIPASGQWLRKWGILFH